MVRHVVINRTAAEMVITVMMRMKMRRRLHSKAMRRYWIKWTILRRSIRCSAEPYSVRFMVTDIFLHRDFLQHDQGADQALERELGWAE